MTKAFFSSDHFFFSSWLKLIAYRALVLEVWSMSYSRHFASSSVCLFFFSRRAYLNTSPDYTPMSPFSSSICWCSDTTLSQTLFLNWGIRFKFVIVSWSSRLKSWSCSNLYLRYVPGPVLNPSWSLSLCTEELYVCKSSLKPSSGVVPRKLLT